MNIYNKMLVVADINHNEQFALARAIKLAEASLSPQPPSIPRPCHITFFLSIYDFSYEMTSLLSREEREAMRSCVINQKEKWMRKIAEPLIKGSKANIDFSIKVVWHSRPYEAIVSEVYRGNFDILIKGTRKHDSLESFFFTPTDWHLLRKSPSPVLLVKNRDWPEKMSIMASLHVTAENDTHLKLNEAIIEQLTHLTQPLNATPYLVNAYPTAPANITIELPDFNPEQYTDSLRNYHLISMKTLRQKYGFSDEQTIVKEGLPEDVVPFLANELNTAMVILGTSGRTGLSAVFIGNTAEQMIDKINCDILALKPEGFIGPLDPNHKK